MNLVSCRGLTKVFDEKTALNGISFDLPAGKVIGVIGKSGSGKTTLLKILAGVLSPNGGVVSVLGNQVGKVTKAQVAYLPEKVCFDAKFSVTDALDFFDDFYADFDRDNAITMLKNMGIDLKTKFGALSNGSCAKVQLALVLSRRAKLYLLDEPMFGIDLACHDYIIENMLMNQSLDSSIVIATNSISDMEVCFDDVLILNDGEIVLYDSADNVRLTVGKSVDEVFREKFSC